MLLKRISEMDEAERGGEVRSAERSQDFETGT